MQSKSFNKLIFFILLASSAVQGSRINTQMKLDEAATSANNGNVCLRKVQLLQPVKQVYCTHTKTCAPRFKHFMKYKYVRCSTFCPNDGYQFQMNKVRNDRWTPHTGKCTDDKYNHCFAKYSESDDAKCILKEDAETLTEKYLQILESGKMQGALFMKASDCSMESLGYNPVAHWSGKGCIAGSDGSDPSDLSVFGGAASTNSAPEADGSELEADGAEADVQYTAEQLEKEPALEEYQYPDADAGDGVGN